MLKLPHSEKGAYRKKAFRLVEIIFLTFACFFVVNLVKLQNMCTICHRTLVWRTLMIDYVRNTHFVYP